METKTTKVSTDLIHNTITGVQTKFESIGNNNVSFKKEGAFALQVLNGNEYLKGVAIENPLSLAEAVVNVALTGLSLNPTLSLAYLVPRGKNVCLEPSYMGLCKILTDAGSIKSIYAYVVYSNDLFKLSLGTEPNLIHQPALNDRGKPIGVYACAVLADNTKQFEYMDIKEVEKLMNKNESVKRGKYSAWTEWWDEMARAKVIRRLYKYLNKSDLTNNKLIKTIELTNDIDFKDEKAKYDLSKKEEENKKYGKVFNTAELEPVPPKTSPNKPTKKLHDLKIMPDQISKIDELLKNEVWSVDEKTRIENGKKHSSYDKAVDAITWMESEVKNRSKILEDDKNGALISDTKNKINECQSIGDIELVVSKLDGSLKNSSEIKKIVNERNKEIRNQN